MQLITVATQEKGYMPILRASCERYNIPLTVLGENAEFTGFSLKYKLMLEYLQGSTDDTSVFCFTDAYDTVVVNPPPEDELARVTEDGTVVVAVDFRANMVVEKFAQIFFRTCNGIRINSGTYFGRRWALVKMLSALMDNAHEQMDDQRLITEYCAMSREKLVIDTALKYFVVWSLHIKCKTDMDKTPLMVIKEPTAPFPHLLINVAQAQRFMSTPADGESAESMSTQHAITRPFLLHAAGNANLDFLLRKLGYNVDSIVHVPFYSHALSGIKNGIYSRTNMDWTSTLKCMSALLVLAVVLASMFWVAFKIRRTLRDIY